VILRRGLVETKENEVALGDIVPVPGVLGRLPDQVINSAAFNASRTSSRADWSRAIVCCVLRREPLAWSR
jgi:hypothetical protein